MISDSTIFVHCVYVVNWSPAGIKVFEWLNVFAADTYSAHVYLFELQQPGKSCTKMVACEDFVNFLGL